MDTDTPGSSGRRATEWLSCGLESLIERVASRGEDVDAFDYDVIVVGSGYGGSMALARLAGHALDGRRLRIALLERGQEYLPGAFPTRFADLAGHVRFSGPGSGRPRGVRTGLFDVRVGPDVHSIVGSGLGGGSLINAGALDVPNDDVFDDPRWPPQIRAEWPTLKVRADEIRNELGAQAFPATLVKQQRMQELAGAQSFKAIPITVAATDHTNAQGVAMKACKSCGDCATGCNHRAKSSLDVTLLVSARRQADVDIYTGASVLRLERRKVGWDLVVVYTDEHRRLREPPLRVRARRVVLAAGTFGSTEILMRSRACGLNVSPLLGSRFSANGDAMTAIYAMAEETRAAAREGDAWEARQVGPTITRCIDLRADAGASGFVIEEMTIPGPLRRAFEEIVVTADAFRRLGEADTRAHPGPSNASDPNAVDASKIGRTLLVATIGHDDADGRLMLDGDPLAQEEGLLTTEWPRLRHDDRFAQRHRTLEELARAGPGGQVLANPMWRALPENVSAILDAPLGPLITVHPLGGCSMGADWTSGVVDHRGRVFVGPDQVLDDLVVLDGSMVPTSLGINPALTIALLADRAMHQLIDEWGYTKADAVPSSLTLDRPVYREPPAPTAPRPTLITVSEKLVGRLALDMTAPAKEWDVALEIHSKPVPLAALCAPNGPRRIELDPRRSRLRVFAPPPGETLGIRKDADAVSVAALSGSLTLFEHAPSRAWQRRWRGTLAWLRNRGVRDLAQGLFERLGGRGRDGNASSLPDLVRMCLALATRAGDARLLEYELSATRLSDTRPGIEGRILGSKTLTYAFASNPWTQLQDVTLSAFPHWTPPGGPPTRLSVDLTFFEKDQSMLVTLVDQQDMPSAIVDLASFFLYLMRTLLHVHVWTFRKPDPAPARAAQRLPGRLPGLPAPQVFEFLVRKQPTPTGVPVLARLTRYRKGSGHNATPVLLIHGYSASGTTFAHPAVEDGGLAGHLAARGRDVWVLDLRSSCGMPTAREPWTFDEIGYADIPIAVDQVLNATRQRQLDVVAHCMGSAMLSMALLGEYPAAIAADDPQLPLRRQLPQRIRRLVMSQVGPRLHMAPANVARAYLMRYLQHYLPLDSYSFRPEGHRGPGEDLLDRLLASVPYPAAEFRLENPIWPPGARTPWVGTRHRMDALYGMTFKLDMMPRAVLDHIDDFFGPLNVRTATQVIHFTRAFRLADAAGRDFVTPALVDQRLIFPILSLHSKHNGLVDYSTRLHMENFMGNESRRSEALPHHGHQDALIGTGARATFARIADFLEQSP